MAIQTSEIVDASSISALENWQLQDPGWCRKSLVEMRMMQCLRRAQKTAESTEMVPNHEFHCCRAAKNSRNCRFWISRPFAELSGEHSYLCTPSQYESLVQDVQDFKKPGGLGQLCTTVFWLERQTLKLTTGWQILPWNARMLHAATP